MKVRTRSVALAFALTLALGACGGGNGDGLSTVARAHLALLVAQVRRAAEAHNPEGAQRALVELQSAVASDRKNGNISAAKAAQILTAAGGVQARLALVATTTTTATTTPTTAPPGRGHGHGGGKGDNGNGGEG